MGVRDRRRGPRPLHGPGRGDPLSGDGRSLRGHVAHGPDGGAERHAGGASRTVDGAASGGGRREERGAVHFDRKSEGRLNECGGVILFLVTAKQKYHN